ncbi:MAG: FtsX-like permease family protein, partial [Acidobacteriota bacterium]
VTLRDLGIRLRPVPSMRGFAVESTRIILDDSTAQAAFSAAADAGLEASGVYSYLANAIRAGRREIPYSVITAVDLGRGAMTSVQEVRGFPPPAAPPGADDPIWLNEWAWRDLGAARGDLIEVDYYLWQEEGRLETRTARFRLEGAVAMGGDVDASLAPEYPGITGARSITAWDPPFPMDLRRIRPADEDYWDRYKAAPKAFVTLAAGQAFWQSRYGRHSAVRVALPAGADLAAAQEDYAERLLRRLDPEEAGFSVSDIRERGLAASRGSTDFGEYFVYFSFFLIAAALLLAALFFRLGIEQRSREIGTLRAAGFPPNLLGRIFLIEGAVLSVAGSILGLAGAIGYGRLLVLALSTWWVDAVGTNRLHLHLSWTDLGAGAVAGTTASLLANAWTLRSLQRNSPRALLAGDLEPLPLRRRRARLLGILSGAAFATALLLIIASALGQVSDVAGFFGAGSLLLISILSLTALWLRRRGPRPIAGHGWPAFFRLGARNAGHRPGRSLLCMALVASAAFIIVSAEAFRRDERSLSLEPSSGTGGYPLLAHSSLPIVYDPDSEAGREALGIPASEAPDLVQVRFVPFRVRPGDDVSCLNLYAPQEPRILGASRSFAAGARFSFRDSLASSPEERRNPWLLLETALPDGAVPAIADANTIQYTLQLAVGRDLVVRGAGGTPVRLRLVAALRDSIFQGELLISEENFLRIFPDREGFRFFLLSAPPALSASLTRSLEERLADWGIQVESTRRRLAAFHQVENAYISTFQSLGGLGLVLGTVGLATILLRNVLERRRELALLRAAGYRRGVISGIIVAENLVLLVWGLACGTVSALTAVLPALHSRGMPFPVSMVGLLLGAVLIVGLASSLVAVIATHRSPLLEALRSE